MQSQQYNGLINKNKFAYRSILANENLIMNKYASQNPSSSSNNQAIPGLNDQIQSITPPKMNKIDNTNFSLGKAVSQDVPGDYESRHKGNKPVNSLTTGLDFFRQRSLKKAEITPFLIPSKLGVQSFYTQGSQGPGQQLVSPIGSPGLPSDINSASNAGSRLSIKKKMTMDKQFLGSNNGGHHNKNSITSLGIPIPNLNTLHAHELLSDRNLAPPSSKNKKANLSNNSLSKYEDHDKNSHRNKTKNSQIQSNNQNGPSHHYKVKNQQSSKSSSNEDENQSSSEMESDQNKKSSRLKFQRKSILQSKNVIDLEQPGLKHIDTYKSLQNNFDGFKNRLNKLQPVIERPSLKQNHLDITPAVLKRNNTFKSRVEGPIVDVMGSENFDQEYEDESSSNSSFRSESYDSESASGSSSSFREDDQEEDQDDDLVVPGKAFKQKIKEEEFDEVETAKQFLIGGNILGSGQNRRKGIIRDQTFKTDFVRHGQTPNGLLNTESEREEEEKASENVSEDDSLKSEINSQDLNDMVDIGVTERAEFNDTITIQQRIQSRNSIIKNRGTAVYKRQQIHLSKYKKDDQQGVKSKFKNKKTGKSKNKKDKGDDNFKRKKSRVLKRKQTLFKGDQEAVDQDSNYLLDEQIMKDSQKLRDIYKFKKFIILPDDAFRGRWEIMITVLLLFTACVTPYRIAFVQVDDMFWSSVDIGTDGVFFIDMILNFFTAFQDSDDELITDRKKIASSYLKSWFGIDLISVLPISQILAVSDYASLARIARLPKLYRLIKMAKLTRILKMIKERNTISKYLNEVLKLSVGFERLSFFALIFIISVHIVSCFWVILAGLQDNVYQTWIFRSNMQDQSDGSLYLAAFYFTIVIVTTIGYGDITVRTPVEQVFCIMLLVVGVVSFSFAIGSLSSILSSLDAKAAKLKEKLQILNDIQSEYKIPYELFRRLRLALRYDHSKNLQEEINFLNELPQNLKVELSLVMHQEIIKQVKFFKKRQPHFIAFVGPMLKKIKVEKNQYIYKEGDPIDEIYFLVSGQAGYALNNHNDQVYVIIDQSYYFGEIDFIFMDENGENDGKRKFSAKALEDCDLLVLNKQDLLLADQEFEDVVSDLFKNAMHRLKRTLKIKKESIKFYEKQHKFQNHTGQSMPGFQPRLSQAPRTRSNFTFANILEENHQRFLNQQKGGGKLHRSSQKSILENQKSLMPNIQQIDDGELDDALYGSSSDLNEQRTDGLIQSKHHSLQQSLLNQKGLSLNEKVNQEILMKTTGMMIRQNSKFSRLDRSLKTFEEDNVERQDSINQNKLDDKNDEFLEESVSLTEEELKTIGGKISLKSPVPLHSPSIQDTGMNKEKRDSYSKRQSLNPVFNNQVTNDFEKKRQSDGFTDQVRRSSFLINGKNSFIHKQSSKLNNEQPKINFQGKKPQQEVSKKNQFRTAFAQKIMNQAQQLQSKNNQTAGVNSQNQVNGSTTNLQANKFLAQETGSSTSNMMQGMNIITEESDGRQGEFRWNQLKQALNKKVQNIKINHFQVPAAALQSHKPSGNNPAHGNLGNTQSTANLGTVSVNQIGPGNFMKQKSAANLNNLVGDSFRNMLGVQKTNQNSRAVSPSQDQSENQIINGIDNQAQFNANQDKFLKIEQNNKVLYTQLNEKIDKFEQTLGKISNLISVLTDEQVEEQKISQQQRNENINNQNSLNGQNELQMKEMIKKMIRDAYQAKINAQNNSNQNKFDEEEVKRDLNPQS